MNIIYLTGYFILLFFLGQSYYGDYAYIILSTVLIIRLNLKREILSVNKSVVMFAGITCLFTVLSIKPHLNPRIELSSLFFIIYSLLFLLSMSDLLKKSDIIYSLRILVILVVILEHFPISKFSAQSMLINKNFIGMLIFIGIIIEIIHLINYKKFRILSGLMILLYIYTVHLISSRGIYLTFFITVLFLFLNRIYIYCGKRKTILWIGTALPAILIIMFYIINLKSNDPLSMKRILIYKDSIDLTYIDRIFGIGFGGIKSLNSTLTYTYDKTLPFRTLKKFSSAHSSIIELFTSTGAAGFIFIFSSIIVLIFYLFKGKKDDIFFIVFSILFNSIFDVTLSCNLILGILIILCGYYFGTVKNSLIKIRKNSFYIPFIIITGITIYFYMPDFLLSYGLTDNKVLTIFRFDDRLYNLNNENRSYLKKAVELAPYEMEYSFNLSRYYYRDHNPDASIRELRRIQRSNPYLYHLFEKEAIIYYFLKIPAPETRKKFSYMNIIEPESPEGYFFLYDFENDKFKKRYYLNKIFLSYYYIENFKQSKLDNERLDRFQWIAKEKIDGLYKENYE